MAESSIKISLELADAAAQKALSDFISKSGSADKSLNKLKNTGTSTFNEITVGIGKSLGVFDIFAGNLAANLVTKGFDAMLSSASALFDVFIVDGVKAAIEAEEALNSLNVAMAQSGVYSEKASEDFKAFAEQLQATTTFEDDLIIKNAALLQSLGNLDNAGLKRATEASLNLSAALGKDLSTVVEALGKAANGNVTSLQKMGLTIQKGTTDAETFANALGAIESRFDGAAASKVNTFGGAIAQATNAFGNLTESIGNVIVSNPVFIAVIGELGFIIRKLTESTDNSNSAFARLAGEGLSTFLGTASFVVSFIDVIARSFQTLFGVLQTLTIPIGYITIAFRAMTVGFSQAKAEFDAFASAAATNVRAFGEAGDGALFKVAQDLDQLKGAADRGLGALASGATGSVAPLNNTKTAIKEVSEETKKAQDRLKSFAEELVKAGEGGESAGALRIEEARAESEAKIAILERQFADQEISEMEYVARKAALAEQVEAARVAQVDAQYAADLARLDAYLKQKGASEATYTNAKAQLETEYRKNKLKAETDQSKRELAIELELKKQKEKQNQAVLQGTSEMFGGLAALAATGGKKMFEITKAFNLAEAITAGILAVQKAAASAPPPFNIPAIVGASAMAAANVIRITQTKAPSFQDGGIVPGSSYSGDRVQANVNSGEMILNRGQQKTLFNMANGGGGSSLEAKLDTLIGLFASKDDSVVVNIGGRTIVETLRSELASGRTFA